MKANALLTVVSHCPRAWFPRKAEAIDRREIGARRQTLQVLTTRKRSVQVHESPKGKINLSHDLTGTVSKSRFLVMSNVLFIKLFCQLY